MPGRVLAGLRILDLTRVVAGPFATAVLADLGADVIKLEMPGTGDDYRYGPSAKGQTSLSFQNTNRGKRSVTLDLRKPEGRELFLRLCERADAVAENFRAGWLAAQGLGADAIQARNPRCVVASLSGFGATGPRAGQASYDIVAQATGGLLAMTGFPDGPPVRGGGALADFVGGLYLGLGIAAPFLARAHGQGPCSDPPTRTRSSRSPTRATSARGSRAHEVSHHSLTAPYTPSRPRRRPLVIATATTTLPQSLRGDRP